MLSRLAAPATTLVLLALGACSAGVTAEEPGGSSDSIEVPEVGACRALTPEDVARPDNASAVVDCAEEHTAETFTVGTFPGGLAVGDDIDDPDLGAYIYDTCNKRFQAFLGGDESLVMRSMLTWAWFRPSQEAWDKGARWYRCDVVGGGEQSESFVSLPETAKGLLRGKPDDQWMTCVDGDTVAGSPKIPCSEPHDWRAVTTIKLGEEKDPYPGDRMVEVQSRDYCSDSVGAWLNYPVDYDYGYTYFHEAEWTAGNRRSICWAKTDQ